MQDLKVEGVGVPTTAFSPNETLFKVPSESPKDKVEALRRVHVFTDLPEDQLQWFADNTEERKLLSGEVLFRKGEKPVWMAIYLEGEIHAYRDDATHDGYVYIARAGDPASEVSGMLPFSRMTQLAATGYAVVPTRALLFPVSLFPELLQRMPLLAQRLVGIMSDRVRESTKVDQQRDKLIALGKLSAGLAHELNNPAAAAGRAADELFHALEKLRVADLNLCRHNLPKEQRAAIGEFEEAVIAQAAAAEPIGALEQSDREDVLSAWLEQHGIENSWDCASTLVEAGFDTDKLAESIERINPAAFSDVLARVSGQLTAAKLTSEIKTSTGRISELVGAIKEYSYMDRAAVQPVNIHKGLDNTLLILKYKLSKKNITVIRDYGENVPILTAYGSELNQVWTNLIDNAVDAMPEGGSLKVRTKLEPTDVLIEIRDNGAGIPQELQSRIFEPFFTTKSVGEGTGLGLAAVVRVIRNHSGNIRVESKPGDTCFQVRLPLDPQIGVRQK